jgi:uncharacterized protein YkwD
MKGCSIEIFSDATQNIIATGFSVDIYFDEQAAPKTTMSNKMDLIKHTDQTCRNLGFAAAFCFTAFSQVVAETSSIPYSHGDPTNYEQYQLELINAARANPSAEAARLGIDLNQGLTEGRINTDAKQPLAFHPLLLKNARGHSDWMLSTNNFSHAGLSGSTPTERAKGNGYEFGVGENIAYDSTSATPDLSTFTLNTHNNLFKSSAHRANLMDASYSVIGLGLRTGQFSGLNALMVTQNFSSGGNSVDSGPFLLGVVYDDKNVNGVYDPGEGLEGVRVEPNYGGYHAITSVSGGYALPLPPNSSLTEDYPIPLAVQTSTWEQVRPYEDTFRSDKISSAALMNLQIMFSGGNLNISTIKSVDIPTPTRINYKLKGTDGYYYPRTMVSSINVKADIKVSTLGITSDLSTVVIAQNKVMPRYTITTNFGAKSFSAKGLPSGLKLKSTNGVISGKPTKKGTYTVTLTAKKMKGKKVEQQATAKKIFIVN